MIANYIQKPNSFEPTTPCYLCIIITQLCRNDAYKQRLVSEGCIAALKVFIQSNIRSTILCVCGCSALDSLSKKPQHSAPPKKAHAANNNSGVGFIFSLLKGNKYDQETYASIFNSLAFIVSMDSEKAYSIVQAADLHILSKITSKFIDNYRITTEFATLMYSSIKYLNDQDNLKLVEGNVEPLSNLLIQITKRVTKSADAITKIAYIFYVFATNFIQRTKKI